MIIGALLVDGQYRLFRSQGKTPCEIADFNSLLTATFVEQRDHIYMVVDERRQCYITSWVYLRSEIYWDIFLPFLGYIEPTKPSVSPDGEYGAITLYPGVFCGGERYLLVYNRQQTNDQPSLMPLLSFNTVSFEWSPDGAYLAAWEMDYAQRDCSRYDAVPYTKIHLFELRENPIHTATWLSSSPAWYETVSWLHIGESDTERMRINWIGRQNTCNIYLNDLSTNCTVLGISRD